MVNVSGLTLYPLCKTYFTGNALIVAMLFFHASAKAVSYSFEPTVLPCAIRPRAIISDASFCVLAPVTSTVPPVPPEPEPPVDSCCRYLQPSGVRVTGLFNWSWRAACQGVEETITTICYKAIVEGFYKVNFDT